MMLHTSYPAIAVKEFCMFFNFTSKSTFEVGNLDRLNNDARSHSWEVKIWAELIPQLAAFLAFWLYRSLRNGPYHTQSGRGPFMEISGGIPAGLWQMHESPSQAGLVNQVIHKLQLSEVLSTAVQQVSILAQDPALEQCRSLWDFSFSLKKTNFIVFSFIIEIMDAHYIMFLTMQKCLKQEVKIL